MRTTDRERQTVNRKLQTANRRPYLAASAALAASACSR